jgi:hypothetical protein
MDLSKQTLFVDLMIASGKSEGTCLRFLLKKDLMISRLSPSGSRICLYTQCKGPHAHSLPTVACISALASALPYILPVYAL